MPHVELQEIPYEGVGVGHTVWDAAVVLALFLRSPKGAYLLTRAAADRDLVTNTNQGTGARPRLPRVLELGAGLGLPGRDLAQRSCVASVTLSDSRSAFLEQLEQLSKLEAVMPGAAIDYIPLNWHSDEDVAKAAEAAYDVVIASDVAYYQPDVSPRKPLRLIRTTCIKAASYLC